MHVRHYRRTRIEELLKCWQQFVDKIMLMSDLSSAPTAGQSDCRLGVTALLLTGQIPSFPGTNPLIARTGKKCLHTASIRSRKFVILLIISRYSASFFRVNMCYRVQLDLQVRCLWLSSSRIPYTSCKTIVLSQVSCFCWQLYTGHMAPNTDRMNDAFTS